MQSTLRDSDGWVELSDEPCRVLWHFRKLDRRIANRAARSRRKGPPRPSVQEVIIEAICESAGMKAMEMLSNGDRI